MHQRATSMPVSPLGLSADDILVGLNGVNALGDGKVRQGTDADIDASLSIELSSAQSDSHTRAEKIETLTQPQPQPRPDEVRSVQDGIGASGEGSQRIVVARRYRPWLQRLPQLDGTQATQTKGSASGVGGNQQRAPCGLHAVGYDSMRVGVADSFVARFQSTLPSELKII